MSYATYNHFERNENALWELEYYETKSGNIPARDFLHSLRGKMRAKAYKELELLEELGTQISMPYSRPMKDGLFELRIQATGDIARVFYFFFAGKKIILTNGFIKKTSKTPPSELATALRYKADYEGRPST
jgi:phage-related protein